MANVMLLRGTTGSGKSTVAAAVADRLTSARVIEVDQLKLDRYGTTFKCIPSEDFLLAGQMAKTLADRDFQAIVVEPFCDRNHFEYVLRGLEVRDPLREVVCVWLQCRLRTALRRKEGTLWERICTAYQYSRYRRRFRPDGEVVIVTDDLPVAEVAGRIWRLLAGGGDGGKAGG